MFVRSVQGRPIVETGREDDGVWACAGIYTPHAATHTQNIAEEFMSGNIKTVTPPANSLLGLHRAVQVRNGAAHDAVVRHVSGIALPRDHLLTTRHRVRLAGACAPWR